MSDNILESENWSDVNMRNWHAQPIATNAMYHEREAQRKDL